MLAGALRRVHALTRRGHAVTVQAGAGEGAAIPDDEYAAAGAAIGAGGQRRVISEIEDDLARPLPMMRLLRSASSGVTCSTGL